MASITFKKLTINSFAGIDKSTPIVIDLEDYYKKGKRIAKLSGDQGTGKSSVLSAILYAAAQEFDFKLVNLINAKDGTISEELEFEKDGKQYKVKATKSKFELFRLFRDGEETRWIAESDPKTNVTKLIGQIATSPMFLKSLDGKKQVEWLYTMLQVPAEVKEKEEKLKTSLKQITEARKEANKAYEGTKKMLLADEMYQDWEQSEKEFAAEKSAESEKKKLSELDSKISQFHAAEQKLATLKIKKEQEQREIEDIQEQINALQERLKNKTQNLSDTEAAINSGEKWVSENKNVKEEHESALQSYMQIERYLVKKAQWEAIKKKKAEMDELETAVQEADAKKDEIREELRKLSAAALPPIEGLEVVTDESIEGKEIGVYVNGKTPAQLCESELFDLYFQLAEYKQIRILVIENLNSLGSAAVDTLNKLAEKGAYIWYSEMKRNQNKLKIEFTDKIN